MTSLQYMAQVRDFSAFRLTTVNTWKHGTRQFLVVEDAAPSPTRLFAVSDRFHPFFFQVFSGGYTSAKRGIGGVLQGQRVGFEPLMEKVVTPEAVGFRWDWDAYLDDPNPAKFLPGWADEEETVESRLERPAVSFGEHGVALGHTVWDARKVALWLDHDHWVQGHRVWTGWSRLLLPPNWVLVGVPGDCAQAWQSPAYEEMLEMERRLATLDAGGRIGHPRLARELAQLGQRWHDLGETLLARKALEWATESYMGAEGGGRAADQIYEQWNPVYQLGEIDPLQIDGPCSDQFSRYWASWFGRASQEDALRDQNATVPTNVDGGWAANFLSDHVGRSTEKWRQYLASWLAWYPSGWRGDERYRAVVMRGAHNCYVGLWRQGDWGAYFFDRYGFLFAEGGHATFGGQMLQGLWSEQLQTAAVGGDDDLCRGPTLITQYVGNEHAYAFDEGD